MVSSYLRQLRTPNLPSIMILLTAANTAVRQGRIQQMVWSKAIRRDSLAFRHGIAVPQARRCQVPSKTSYSTKMEVTFAPSESRTKFGNQSSKKGFLGTKVGKRPPSSTGSHSNLVSGVPCVSSPVPKTLPGAEAG